ncbi:hypothetical protein GPALN_005932 [Globodera pallida]|nr:hypothetical protein GPALN_005932 [Globodera pallida]
MAKKWTIPSNSSSTIASTSNKVLKKRATDTKIASRKLNNVAYNLPPDSIVPINLNTVEINEKEYITKCVDIKMPKAQKVPWAIRAIRCCENMPCIRNTIFAEVLGRAVRKFDNELSECRKNAATKVNELMQQAARERLEFRGEIARERLEKDELREEIVRERLEKDELREEVARERLEKDELREEIVRERLEKEELREEVVRERLEKEELQRSNAEKDNTKIEPLRVQQHETQNHMKIEVTCSGHGMESNVVIQQGTCKCRCHCARGETDKMAKKLTPAFRNSLKACGSASFKKMFKNGANANIKMSPFKMAPKALVNNHLTPTRPSSLIAGVTSKKIIRKCVDINMVAPKSKTWARSAFGCEKQLCICNAIEADQCERTMPKFDDALFESREAAAHNSNKVEKYEQYFNELANVLMCGIDQAIEEGNKATRTQQNVAPDQIIALVKKLKANYERVRARILKKREVTENPCPLFSSPAGDDLTVHIGDRQVPVSASWLMFVSPVVERMLSVEMKEKQQRALNLDGLGITMEQFMQFLEIVADHFRHGRTLPNPTNVLVLLALADYFQIDWLKDRCEAHLINCVEIPLIERFHLIERFRLNSLRNFFLSLNLVTLKAFLAASYHQQLLPTDSISPHFWTELAIRLCREQ